jgi:hypothetical protein
MFNADKNLVEKWTPVLDHEDAPSIGDKHKRAVTARLLENQELALQESRAHSDFQINETAANATGSNISNFDPV